MSMQILVVGGGIGGMAAAIAVARAGGDARVFERVAVPAEVGAGIQLGPNATRVLNDWGLQHALASCAAFPEALVSRSAVSGARLAQLPLRDRAPLRYGAPYATVHRADLLSLLQRAAGLQSQVRLRAGVEVAGHREFAGGVTVRRTDGVEIEGDALIAADGLWSQVRERQWGDGQPRDTGHVAYRALLAQSAMPAALRSNDVTAWMGTHVHVVQYPVRGGEWMNVVVIVDRQAVTTPAPDVALPAEPIDQVEPAFAEQSEAGDRIEPVAAPVRVHDGLPGPDRWDQKADLGALARATEGMCTPLRDLLGLVDGWRCWHLHDRPPVPGPDALAQGRIALLGDAAHPMLPFLAQGAGMAIEDAAELGRSLALVRPDVRDVLDLPMALRRYALNRWQRVARVQAQAVRNGQVFHETGLRRVGRDAALRLLGGRLMDMPWLYGPAAGA